MAQKVTVCVDVLGGDNAVDFVLAGVNEATQADPDLTVLLTGPDDIVTPFAEKHERVEAHPTTEFISMEEHPAEAIRKKKDSSIVVGCRLVKEGAAQGFFSAGSTGAIMAAGTLVTGRIKGVKRPCITTVFPTDKPMVFMDIGANADWKPEYLLQFGQMGTVYAREILGVEAPKVGLLNIGSEPTKGSQVVQQTYQLLEEKLPSFAGNAEGTDLMTSSFDVIVTDGFTGNAVLKTVEGTAKFIMHHLKSALMSSTKSKLGALLIKDALYELKDLLDADAYGGAVLLGVKGVIAIGHGHTSQRAVANGIKVTAESVRRDLIGKIEKVIQVQ